MLKQDMKDYPPLFNLSCDLNLSYSDPIKSSVKIFLIPIWFFLLNNEYNFKHGRLCLTNFICQIHYFSGFKGSRV